MGRTNVTELDRERMRNWLRSLSAGIVMPTNLANEYRESLAVAFAAAREAGEAKGREEERAGAPWDAPSDGELAQAELALLEEEWGWV